MKRIVYFLIYLLLTMKMQAQQTLDLNSVTDKLEKDDKAVLNQGKNGTVVIHLSTR